MVQETNYEVCSTKGGGEETQENNNNKENKMEDLNSEKEHVSEGNFVNQILYESSNKGGAEEGNDKNVKTPNPLNEKGEKSASPIQRGCEAEVDIMTKAQNHSEPNEDELKIKNVENGRMGEDSFKKSPNVEKVPAILNEVSDKLKILLSRSTPIKDKMEHCDEEEKEKRRSTQVEQGAGDLEEFGGELGFRPQEGEETQKRCDVLERRITRSQSRQYLKIECRKITNLQKAKSQELKINVKTKGSEEESFNLEYGKKEKEL
ncbi:hypothetical protein L1887_31624 [Cichorium endivia]|nr:hypothetical protein L1887_31624 [Cichorium endivia]